MPGQSALKLKKAGGYFKALPEEIFIPGIDDDKDHYLADVDKQRHQIDDNMVRNMMVHGVIEAIVATKEGERIVCVFGRRRLLHLREANKRLVAEGKKPHLLHVQYRKGAEKDLYGVFISENEHRLDDTMLGKARKAERMRNLLKASDQEICIDFGVSIQTVNNWSNILELNPKVIKLIEEDKIDASTALELCKVPWDEQYDKATEIIKAAGNGKKPSRRQVSRSVDPDKPRAPAKKLVQRLVASKPTGVSDDFLRGLQLGRGLISEKDAGVADLLDEFRSKKPPKKQDKSKSGVRKKS